MIDGIRNAAPRLSRRSVLQTGAGAGATAVLAPAWDAGAHTVPPSSKAETGSPVRIKATVNGEPLDITIDSRASLLDLLRERLQLSGTKKGCDHGQCGACTVHLDGRPAVACLTMAAKLDGVVVTTIEGIARDGNLHPVQRAFVDHDALQCGYCTPGQIMSALACVQQGQANTADAIREFMSGNICRCGAYVGIVAAIRAVAAGPRTEVAP